MEYVAKNIEAEPLKSPAGNDDVVTHNGVTFKRVKVFGSDGKVLPILIPNYVSLRKENPILKTSTVGLTDTYTIYFTDGTTTTFSVTNGAIYSDDGTLINATIANKYDKTGGKVSGKLWVGYDMPNSQLFNVYNRLKILDDEIKSVIVGDTVNSAGAKFYTRHDDMNWVVPSGNAGMIGIYSDLYLHQTLSAYSTVVGNESYVNISLAPGVENLGAHIGYLGGVMIQSGHRGSLGAIRGAEIVNRIRTGASGTISDMVAVDGSVTAYGTNTTYIENFIAFHGRTTTNLFGATINRAYGCYIGDLKKTGINEGFAFYNKSNLDKNFFAGKTTIGYALPTDAPVSTHTFDVNGSARFTEGINVGGIATKGNIIIDKENANQEVSNIWRVNKKLRFSLDFTGAETGSDVGSNLVMYRYSDNGNYAGTIYSINRKTGEFEIGENLKVKKVRLKSDGLEATPVAGTLEFDGTDLYFVNGSGTRKKIAFV